MFAEKSGSMMRETLKSLCCSNGWCYGIFWGFDQTNSLLMTLKDAYYEEQLEALIDNMLLQVHVVGGGGVIGQTAFNKDHQWMYSDAHHERQSYLGSSESLEPFQDDSELYCQFSMGIKTIALISVESLGVVQLGSTHKNPETKHFVDQVKQLFRGIDTYEEIKFSEYEAPSDSQFLNSGMMQFGYLNSDCLMVDAKDSLMLPSQSFPSTSDHQLDQLLLESSCFFDSSVLTQSWPSSIEENVCFDFKSERTLDELFRESEPVSKNDLSELFSHPISSSTQFTTLLSNNLQTNSTQSCVTDTFRSNHEVECSNPVKKQMGWNETLIPVSETDDLSFSANIRTSNSLFSRLGLDQILDGINATTSTSSVSFAKLRCEDQSYKRRKLDNQVKTEDVPSSFDTRNTEVKSEASTIGDSYSIDGANTSSSKTRNGKKKAKAGTRPRPKDRQMIQDRLAELRELIPNGEKMSIDRLLERTIRHLDFMQSLMKRADSLKRIEKPKNAGVQKKYSSNGVGVTWACEVGDENMVCPLKVEDLTTPGQMVIEILCEEQGFFLEILDIVRGFGLIVLKGVMEVRETKIWAHFIVEAEGNLRVTRHEVFSSLIQILQMRGEVQSNGNERFGNVMSSGSHIPPFNNCQPAVPFPVNFADSSLQCANL